MKLYVGWHDEDRFGFQTNSIIKLVYMFHHFDISKRKIGTRINTTITSDGNIIIREYRDSSRKVFSSREFSCSAEDFEELCKQFETCINTATKLDWYVDDCGADLHIIYKYGREQTVDRGLGNSDTNISEIFYDFLEKLSIEI